ncbi:LysM peptidoglycan-binding domain-containing protein [Vulcaniibacterium thermophilum]|jgi:nucleoid-associated protein YgaU|uniref:LysM domain-containing protein n=1 Tax=Vulcaniibacterium thermophilum TaxID=1169913 RepID=A0A918YX32_9GAMM|nr:LysM peptidoglycan-binding domain-containing protein [Vulcaniibacterium thermophilum]GHE27525.1 hypothetical protein GCM10007167_06210 [Vulcaniibacterium thermophilum]
MNHPDKPRDFSDIQGGARSTEAVRGFGDIQSDARSTETPAGSERTYIVRSGDTLSHIAQQFYGRASRWKALYEANRDLLESPDRIFPGQALRIPDLDDDAF